MDNQDYREALLLVGEGSRFQPAIERRLAAREFGDIMLGGEWFGSR
jgi:hypothetical protein